MLVKKDSASSSPEIMHLKKNLESKNLETAYLQQKIEQKNREIESLRQELKNKATPFFARIKQKMGNLLTLKFSTADDYLHHERKYVVQYPESVIVKASPLFDRNWYLAQYQDVIFSGVEPAEHYLKFGAKKGYNPGPEFSTRDYLSLHPDVKINPLVHYEIFGKIEGRRHQIESENEHPSFVLGKKVKIAFISGEPETPGHLYRIARYMSAAKAINADVAEFTLASAFENLQEISKFNVLFIWRAGWNEQFSFIFTAARKAKIPIIFDVDDLMIDPDLAKVKIIDGIRSANLSEQQVAKFFEAMKIAMHQADYGCAPTTALANYMRSSGKRTFVHPNGFDEQTWQASRLALRTRLNKPSDGLIRIGYAGGSRTHQKDFALIADVIARLLRERSNCRLVLFRKEKLNCTEINEFPALLAVSQQIEWREMVPLTDLPNEMARFDINLAPLEVGNPFCEAKSELKFFESALVEVPVVASPTQTFREAIEDGKTGFLAADEESWYNILSQLLDNPALRKQIARSSYYSVLWKYGLEHRIELMTSMLDIVLQPGSRAARTFEHKLLKSRKSEYTLPTVPAHEVIIAYDKLKTSEVTVVVPSYNYSHYLVEALESVKNQTLLNIDLIIVDDCSTDNSIEIANLWIKKNVDRFNKVMLIKNNVNSGLGLTRNVGFFNAETLFVIPLDPDNSLLPNFATSCLEKMQETHAAFVYPNIQRYGDDNDVMGIYTFDPMQFTCGNYIDAMALIRLSAWAYVGGYHHLKYGWEDYDFWCRFVALGLFGEHVDEILARYRVHEQSMLSKITNKQNNKVKVKEDILSRHSWLRV